MKYDPADIEKITKLVNRIAELGEQKRYITKNTLRLIRARKSLERAQDIIKKGTDAKKVIASLNEEIVKLNHI